MQHEELDWSALLDRAVSVFGEGELRWAYGILEDLISAREQVGLLAKLADAFPNEPDT